MTLFDDSHFITIDDDPRGDRHIRDLLARPTELVVELLHRYRDIELPKSISKDRLRKKLNDFVRGNVLRLTDLEEMLRESRRWGHQQVYLLQFRGSDTEMRDWSKQWSDEQWARKRFKAANLSDIFNNERIVEPSDSPKLFKFEHCLDEGMLRLLWVERTSTLTRIEDAGDELPTFEPSVDGTSRERIVRLTFRETEAREVSSLELVIAKGTATFLIRKLTGRNYRQVRDSMISDLEEVLRIEDLFEPVPLRKLMQRIHLVADMNQRWKKYQSASGRGTATLASGSQDDLFEDTVLKEIAASLEEGADATGVSLAWPVQYRGHLGLVVYARFEGDQRIGIEALALEADVRHALQEVRIYSTQRESNRMRPRRRDDT